MTDQKTGDRPDGALTTRIHQHYGALSPLERRLADVILDCPGEVASYTATELAGLAGVSKMTVSRLVRRLGYDSFEAARLASRGGADWGSPLYLLSKDDPTAAPSLDDHFGQSVEAIAATARLCDPALITRVAAALRDARRVWVFGHRNSAFLAGYARWQFIQFRSEVHTLSGPGETHGEGLADITADDLLFMVAIRRRAPVVERLLRAAVDRAIPLALIIDTHTPLSVAEPALTLRCQTRSLTALDNHVAVMAVIHAVTAELIRQTGAQGRERIGRIEALHEDLGEV